MNQILRGLAEYLVDEINGWTSRTLIEREDEKTAQYLNFQKICQEMTDMTLSEMNEPLNDLEEPHETNKINKFILWLYTMEPPFYLHINNACRFKYTNYIETLGPFVFAFGRIIQSNKAIKMS